MAHCDAAGMNGGNRIISHGAALAADAEWMVGKSRARLAPGLDGGFLMDGTPRWPKGLPSFDGSRSTRLRRTFHSPARVPRVTQPLA